MIVIIQSLGLILSGSDFLSYDKCFIISASILIAALILSLIKLFARYKKGRVFTPFNLLVGGVLISAFVLLLCNDVRFPHLLIIYGVLAFSAFLSQFIFLLYKQNKSKQNDANMD